MFKFAAMEKKTTNGHGGKRNNAGRTPVGENDKKEPLFIYPKKIIVKSLGGREAVKALCEAHLDRLHKKTLK